MSKIKIFIADDHAILRDGLKLVLKTDNSIEIIGEADDGLKTLDSVEKLNPDVLLIDINMPGLSGIEVTRKIRLKNNRMKILFLTMYEQEDIIVEAMLSGANGYLFKMADMDELIVAIKKINSGEDYFNEKVSKIALKSLQQTVHRAQEIKKPHLTTRELEILKLIVKGLTSQQIADSLFISYFTVGKHRKNILEKLGQKNTAELVHFALKEGLIKD
ncbi:MAG: response regulator transcription factor [Ignavibacteriaceae bacterium]|nr:response regulator transcription factor [Ignavibacteriaceae bacterium]HRI46953.1 response regulator transcription factor [Ignavibacteriaceae bacterium]